MKDKKNNRKRALLSFLRYPVYKQYYIGRLRFFFSTHGLVLNILRALNELGYEVDIIDFYNKNFVPVKKYDVFITHTARNFKTISGKINRDVVKICFDTGIYWQIHNKKEKERFDNLKERKGVNLLFDRYIYDGENIDFMLANVDGIISLGGDFTRESYSKTPFAQKLFVLSSALYRDKYFKQIKKDFEKARKNFLFFSGGGNIHKGLDLLLESFVKTNSHLYICTDFDPGFEKIYQKELSRPNIHHVGYLKQGTRNFYDIIDRCAFNIHPSCSEGSPGGVIDLMQYGIIPIISYESNIKVNKFGIQLKENTIEEIKNVIEELSQKPSNWLEEKSRKTKEAAFNNFSEKVFLKNMKDIIGKIIRKTKIN